MQAAGPTVRNTDDLFAALDAARRLSRSTRPFSEAGPMSGPSACSSVTVVRLLFKVDHAGVAKPENGLGCVEGSNGAAHLNCGHG